ncbi:MAG: phosphatase PAP2 family protein [Candidatus Nealsonbacteria bacterium]|nr:phosphatase PAP2 family protein [Candidatus Nealsonbacteria bacterium]
MDKYLFDSINNLAGRWVWLDKLAVFLAIYSEYILLLILIVFLVLKFKERWKMGATALISAIISRFVLCSGIRMLWFRPRPFVLNNVNLLVNYDGKEASFPSGHASFYFALSTVVYLYNKKLGIFFYIFTVFMTLSRVFIGVHWPFDILFGALLGISVGLVGDKIFKKLFKSKEIIN